MTWPNTAISTTYLDAGSDRPSQARADIKLMADAVNAMITEGNGSKYIKIGLTTSSSAPRVGNPGDDGFFYYRSQLSLTQDPGSIGTLSDSNYRITLPAGNYLTILPPIKISASNTYDCYLHDVAAATDAASTLDWSKLATSNSAGFNILVLGDGTSQAADYFSLAQATTFEMRTRLVTNQGATLGQSMHVSYFNLIKF